MQLKIKSQHLNLSDAQKETIENKVTKLSHLYDRLSDESAEFRVEVRHEKARKTSDAYNCQITIFAPNAVIRAETRDETLDNALDACVSKIRVQIERYKAKMLHLDKRSENGKEVVIETAFGPEGSGPEREEEAEFEIPNVLRRKRFSRAQPMTEKEAIEQMELVGHQFFHFNNAETGRFSVIYKRHDGYYGIIEPKLPTD